jgi:hypothetical protein
LPAGADGFAAFGKTVGLPENVNFTRVGINAHPTGRANDGFLPAGADGFAASGKTVGQPEKPENRLPA